MTTSLLPGASPTSPPALLRASRLVAPVLDDVVGRLDPSLREAARHHLAGGGKHVRAGITLLAAAAAGGAEEDAICGAVAVELVHNYSLIHDDIIDGDRERRHRPTVWAEYGVGTAIVVGDALAALATEVLLEDPSARRVRAASKVAAANQEMIGGQAADMAFERRSEVTVEECTQMERGKTGALLSCAAAVGALLGGGDDDVVDALADYGEHLGIAFQAIDDLLGMWGDPAVTGKPVGADLLARKKTLPVAVALQAGADEAKELRAILSGRPDQETAARAADLIAATGARDEVAAMADASLQAALGALERVELAAGPKQELVAVARFVTARDR